MKWARRWVAPGVVVFIVLLLAALVILRLLQPEAAGVPRSATDAIPVEVAPVEHGPIADRRTFSGTLEATARVTIAPKIAGRIASLPLDIADTVERGQIVARLDSDESEQAVAQAEAELAVARAELGEAESAATIAQRELERVQTLHDRGIASDSQLDTVRAGQLSKKAAVEVAKAHVVRAEAAVQAAQIRLGYATVRAHWEGGDDQRIVAERYAEEGDTVGANTPLLSIIELSPIEAVVFATEREYALLKPGQSVTLTTDAYPDRRWTGQVARVAPMFREGSRQARVEIRVPNEDGALKPGLFVRVDAVLGREDNATIVPAAALTRRDGRDVVFVVAEDTAAARLTPVRIGIREGERVQVIGEGVAGRVVTLGQQLLGDGAAISLPGEGQMERSQAPAPAQEAAGG